MFGTWARRQVDLVLVMSCLSQCRSASLIRQRCKGCSWTSCNAGNRPTTWRFGTCAEEFCVPTVDPKFSLGDFEVTLLAYHHQMRKPVFMGPLFIHFRKKFSTFLCFALSLVGLHHDLNKLKAFGTSKETFVDAFSRDREQYIVVDGASSETTYLVYHRDQSWDPYCSLST